MRLAACATALAITVAGASSLYAEPSARRGEWNRFFERCEHRSGAKKSGDRLERAVRKMSRADREELTARLRRVAQLTESWRRAERQAKQALLVRRVAGILIPQARGMMDLRPVMTFILKMNGLEPAVKRSPPRKGRMLI